MPIFNRITYGPVEASEAYAVFDSSDGSFTFFRDAKGKYTDGQVSETKTYYTGFEDITGETKPSWFDSDNYEQKNTIKTALFKDKIRPKTCYCWFNRADALTSITGLDKLDTAAVTDMNSMFMGCRSLTSLDVSNFNTENVTDMTYMFYDCESLTSLDLSSFNTEKVTDMRAMFGSCRGLTSLDLSSFNTAAVTDMDCMFNACGKLTNLNLSSFNTAAVTDMHGMFNSCSLTSLDVSSFNTKNVTNMSYMFENCRLTSLDLSSFNTENVTTLDRMFQYCSSLTSLDLSSFNTGKVTNMSSMFSDCSSLTSLDLSSFNTENVTGIGSMFSYCSSLKTIYASSLFTTDAVSSSGDMFYFCFLLTGGAGTGYEEGHDDATYARIDGGTSNPGYFTAKQAYAVYDSTDQSMTFFRDIPRKYTDGQVSGTKTYYTGFEDITEKTKPSWLDSSSGDQKNKVKTVIFKDKISPKTCYWWFYGAVSLTSITGLDKLDMAAVTNMNSMFYNCNSLTSLDVSSFNTAKVTNMGGMFQNCNKLTSLDVSSFNTENVKYMYYMFYNCNSLTSLDVSSFNTAKVTDMGGMFQNCGSLTSLDVSSFNTENVKYMLRMFSGCRKLKTIYASSLFTTNAVSSSGSMFINSASLVGGAGTKYNANYVDKTYARIDGGTSNPGYFTAKVAPVKASLQR